MTLKYENTIEHHEFDTMDITIEGDEISLSHHDASFVLKFSEFYKIVKSCEAYKLGKSEFDRVIKK